MSNTIEMFRVQAALNFGTYEVVVYSRTEADVEALYLEKCLNATNITVVKL